MTSPTIDPPTASAANSLNCLQCYKPLQDTTNDGGVLHVHCVDLFRSLAAPVLHEGEFDGIVCTVNVQKRFGFLNVSKLPGNVHFSFTVLPPGCDAPRCKEAFAVQVRPTQRGFTAISMRALGKMGQWSSSRTSPASAGRKLSGPDALWNVLWWSG